MKGITLGDSDQSSKNELNSRTGGQKCAPTHLDS